MGIFIVERISEKILAVSPVASDSASAVTVS